MVHKHKDFRIRGTGGRNRGSTPMSNNSSQLALTPEDVLELLEQRNRAEYPVMSGTQIRDALAEDVGIDVTRKTVKKRLYSLERSGEIAFTKETRDTLYWLPGEFEGMGPGEAEVVTTPEDPPEVEVDGAATGPAVDAVNRLREDLITRLEDVEQEVARAEQSDELDEQLGESVERGEATKTFQQRAGVFMFIAAFSGFVLTGAFLVSFLTEALISTMLMGVSLLFVMGSSVFALTYVIRAYLSHVGGLERIRDVAEQHLGTDAEGDVPDLETPTADGRG